MTLVAMLTGGALLAGFGALLSWLACRVTVAHVGLLIMGAGVAMAVMAGWKLIEIAMFLGAL